VREATVPVPVVNDTVSGPPATFVITTCEATEVAEYPSTRSMAAASVAPLPVYNEPSTEIVQTPSSGVPSVTSDVVGVLKAALPEACTLSPSEKLPPARRVTMSWKSSTSAEKPSVSSTSAAKSASTWTSVLVAAAVNVALWPSKSSIQTSPSFTGPANVMARLVGVVETVAEPFASMRKVGVNASPVGFVMTTLLPSDAAV
jgi:hypothetical protein